jgi:ubiquinone/menaquinone biosynthesis C-methylase UbiE
MRWNAKYAHEQGSELKWYVDAPPEELLNLLRSSNVTRGNAVDLGCGPGAITAHLCRHFKSIIGIDIAENGLRQAQIHCSKLGVSPTFVCGDARQLPLANESVDFLFDRGCLQGVSLADWPAYFSELERTLKREGIAQILCRNRKEKSSAGSRWNFWNRRRSALKQLDNPRSPRQIIKYISSAFEILSLNETPFLLRTGVKIYFTHIILKKK